MAVSNSRLLSLAAGKVTFRAKNYRQGRRRQTLTLSVDEFLRRFVQHVLPRGFVRVRYYGLLAHRHRESRLARCRELLHAAPAPPPSPVPPPSDPTSVEETSAAGARAPACRVCGAGHLRRM
jgi:hypothetical protein